MLLCIVMLCHVMIRSERVRYVMLCFGMNYDALWYDMFLTCEVVARDVALCDRMLWHAMLYYDTLCFVMLGRALFVVV